jgi:hypothetical protein
MSAQNNASVRHSYLPSRSERSYYAQSSLSVHNPLKPLRFQSVSKTGRNRAQTALNVAPPALKRSAPFRGERKASGMLGRRLDDSGRVTVSHDGPQAS